MSLASSPTTTEATPARARGLGKTGVALGSLTALLGLVVMGSASLGAVRIGLGDVVLLLVRPLGLGTSHVIDAQAQAVFFAIRLPRIFLGALVGATLSAAGAALQGLFRNPLAEPTLIGISSGGSLAAVGAILVAAKIGALFPMLAVFWVPLASFGGSLFSTQVLVAAARLLGSTGPSSLLLIGVANNALFMAGTGLVMYAANDAQLRSITFWTLGSLGGATWPLVAAMAPLALLSLAGLLWCAPGLNLLLLGEAEAGHSGLDVRALRLRVVVLVALGVGASVAVSGMITFVGLVVPHLVRLALGPDHRRLMPATALLGASLLCVADLVARTVVSPSELPLGVVTALCGAPFFLWLLLREARQRRLS